MEIKVSRCKTSWEPPKAPVVYFELPQGSDISGFKKLEDKTLGGYILTLKKPRKRSLTANAYMWQLCDKIGVKIRATKEDVYRRAVREVGAYTDMTARHEDIPQIKAVWETNGIGWFVEQHHQTDTVAVLRFYQGSSVYNGEQMRRLIDFVVDEAMGLGIETMTPAEIERLKQLWEGG